MRLPALQGDLKAIDADSGAEVVWAVGVRGLIFGTTDGGRTWTRGVIQQNADPSSKTSQGGAPRATSWNFIRGAVAAETPAKAAAQQAPAKDPQAGSANSKIPAPPSGFSIVEQPLNQQPLNATGAPVGGAGPPTSSGNTKQGLPSKQPSGSAVRGAATRPGASSSSMPKATQPSRPSSSGSPSSQPNSPPDSGNPNPPVNAAVPLSDQTLFSVRLLGNGVGVAVGESGTILRTTDSGHIWRPVQSPTNSTLRSVAIVFGGKLVAVGDEGVILLSSDIGITWHRVSSPPIRENLVLITARGPGALAIGSDGGVLVGTASGQIWNRSLFPMQHGSVRAAFANLDSVFAIQDNRLLQLPSSGPLWQSIRMSVPKGQLETLTFGDPNHGMVFGMTLNYGFAMVTSDGGRSWKRVAIPVASEIVSVVETPFGVVYAAGSNGAIIRSADFGETWSVMSNGLLFLGMDFSSSTHGITVGDGGVAFVTDDGGESWSAAETSTTMPLTAVSIAAGGRNAVAVGSQGTVRTSSDGGRHWERVVFPDTTQDIEDVQFTSPSHAVAAGDAAWSSDNRGINWVHQLQLLTPAESIAIDGSGFGTLGAVSDLAPLLLTQDAGETWQVTQGASAPMVQGQLFAARRSDARSTVRIPTIFGPSGVASMTGGTATWRAMSQTDIADWRELHAAAFWGSKGIAAGENGIVWRSDDTGQQWRRVSSPHRLDIRGVQFLSERRAVMVAASRVLTSDDAGQTWTEVPYSRYPSPWIWVAGLLFPFALAMLMRSHLRNRNEGYDPNPTIANTAASDKPIGPKDFDAIGLREIALGLSAFLRNTRTEPPLTIAVTGEWGTGKSSLMNLLREDLRRRYGFRPVWFNAWHHQSGENLLGSLLANIHAQAIPSWVTLAGLDFRLRLLRIRGVRFWLRLWVTVFVLATLTFAYPKLSTGTLTLLDLLAKAPSEDDRLLGAAHLLAATTGLLGIIAAGLLPFLAVLHTVSAFGLKPGKLIAAVATTGRSETASLQVGARYRFAREFADFSSALLPRTLVIFIDDLDRCRPENVMEVLEAVNFLVSSGRCVVVLGMARPWVEACVATSFATLAKDSIPAALTERPKVEGTGQTGGVEAQSAQQRQSAFARDYLEKIINIEIKIPRMTEDASLSVLIENSMATRRTVKDNLGQWLQRAVPWVGMTVAPMLVILLAYFTSSWMDQIGLVAPGPSSSSPSTAQKPTGVASSSTAPSGMPTAPASLIKGIERAPVVEEADRSVGGVWYWGVGLPSVLCFIGLLAVLGLVRQQIRVTDSEPFRTALRIMQPWIILACRSPRSLKRFLNNLRYVAMRFHRAQETPTIWQRLLDARSSGDESTERTESKQSLTLPEPVLVALSAIYRCHESWLTELSPLRPGVVETLLLRDFAEQIPDKDERFRIARRLEDAITAFNQNASLASELTPLFVDEMRDRRSFVEFFRIMASEMGSPQVFSPLAENAATPLRETRSA